MVPYKRSAILGGIKAPVVPAQADNAEENGRGYPLRSYAGIIIPPIAAQVAAEAPETAPNN